MKKILAMILALCLLCGAVAFADSTLNQTNTIGQTLVQVVIGETYELKIPSELNIVPGTEQTLLPVEVTEYSLASANKLQVVPKASLNGWLATEAGVNNGPTIWCDLWHPTTDAWAGSSNPLYFTAAATQNLRVRISADEWAKATPGTYSDTVTFTASIVAK